MKLVQLIREWCRDYVVFTNSIVFILGEINRREIYRRNIPRLILIVLSKRRPNIELQVGGEDVSEHLDHAPHRRVGGLRLPASCCGREFAGRIGRASVAFFAYVADVRSGRFKMAVFSTAVCIIVSCLLHIPK